MALDLNFGPAQFHIYSRFASCEMSERASRMFCVLSEHEMACLHRAIASATTYLLEYPNRLRFGWWVDAGRPHIVHRVPAAGSERKESSKGDRWRSGNAARPTSIHRPFSSLSAPLKDAAKHRCGRAACKASQAAQSRAVSQWSLQGPKKAPPPRYRNICPPRHAPGGVERGIGRRVRRCAWLTRRAPFRPQHGRPCCSRKFHPKAPQLVRRGGR